MILTNLSQSFRGKFSPVPPPPPPPQDKTVIGTVLIAESATNSLRQFSHSNSSEGEKLKISDTSSDSPGTSFNIIYSCNEADKSLVWPARLLSPLQIIS